MALTHNGDRLYVRSMNRNVRRELRVQGEGSCRTEAGCKVKVTWGTGSLPISPVT